MTVIALGVLWWVIGFASFVYWWTKEYDLETQDLFKGALVGIVFGPTAFLVGWFIHGDPIPKGRVWIRRRKSAPTQRTAGTE